MDQPENDPVPDETELARLEADLDRVDAALAHLDAGDLDAAEALVEELNAPGPEAEPEPAPEPEPDTELPLAQESETESEPDAEPITRTLHVVRDEPDQD